MEKYQRKDIVGIERENERDENYISKTNTQIDHKRTRLNFHFIKPYCSYIAFINQRLKDLAPKRKVKDDAVLLSSFSVGASPKFFTGKNQDDIDAFFSECTEFFAERYGRKNIISTVVHLDETTPHMHINLIPILEGRPCAKKLFDRNALTILQTDLYKEVGKHWGLERGKEGSPAKHLDTVAYKIKKMKDDAVTAVLQASEAESRKEAAEQRQAHAEHTTHELEERCRQLQREVAPLQVAADVAQFRKKKTKQERCTGARRRQRKIKART